MSFERTRFNPGKGSVVRVDPAAEARRLLEQVDLDLRPELAADPGPAIEVLFDGVTVTLRPPSDPGQGCSVDGTYDPGPPPRILVADDVPPSRQRFTTLHELGHHLIENDAVLADLEVPDEARPDEEICNEVAASILLPDALVASMLPAGHFTAEDVARLHEAAESPSRAACCVAAVRRLNHPGCVILGRPDGAVDFVAHHLATPWRIARGTSQGDDSLLVRAGRAGRARSVTQMRFANGNWSGDVQGDAFVTPDGWVFMVAVIDSHSPWDKGLRFASGDSGAPREVVECPRCDHAFTAWWARCRTCGDHECPQCHRCSCGSTLPAEKRCDACGLLKAPHLFPNGGDRCVDCE